VGVDDIMDNRVLGNVVTLGH